MNLLMSAAGAINKEERVSRTCLEMAGENWIGKNCAKNIQIISHVQNEIKRGFTQAPPKWNRFILERCLFIKMKGLISFCLKNGIFCTSKWSRHQKWHGIICQRVFGERYWSGYPINPVQSAGNGRHWVDSTQGILMAGILGKKFTLGSKSGQGNLF